MTAERPGDADDLEAWIRKHGLDAVRDGDVAANVPSVTAETPVGEADPEDWLTARGFRDVRDWGGFPTQVTGRIPPDWHWFYFRERSGSASIEIFPPDRDPFASPGSDAIAGFDPMALTLKPKAVWSYGCPTPDDLGGEWATAETLIVEWIDLWRRGTLAK